jgi:kynurenine formamidase
MTAEPAAMRRTIRSVTAGGLAVVLQFVATVAVAQQSAPLSRAAFDSLFARVDNAGRWGAQDQLGTLNLVTPAVRRAAGKEVREGVTVSLTREVQAGPVPGAFEPAGVEVLTVSDSVIGPSDGSVRWLAERISLVFHGWAFTHIDALNHLTYGGRSYNGTAAVMPASERAPAGGQREGLFTRGVLVDLPRLGAGSDGGVTAANLEAWERKSGVRIRSGDVVLVRSGRWAPGAAATASHGFHPSAAAWLRERGVVAVGDEGSADGAPSLVPGITSPFHVLAIVAMGMPLLENLDLEALAREAVARSRWTFLLVVAPLDVRNGTGSAVNPIAVF